MSAPTPRDFADVEACIDAIVERVGRDIRIGLPLGLGKPAELINALYARAQRDTTLHLTILSALSLEKPDAGKGLEKAFLQPFLDRVFGGVPDLDYMRDLRLNKLPPNVRVMEFFFKPGSQLNNVRAQRDYICTNYTFAARDVFDQGCNVAAQAVAKRTDERGVHYSLSCNPDTSPELASLLRAAEARGERKIAIVGLVNARLPYMAHDAEVPESLFDFIVDHPSHDTPLFSTPKLPVATPDYAIGLQASALIPDGGTVQIGIGALGDAIVHAAQLRHTQNAVYRDALTQLGTLEQSADLVRRIGDTAPFVKGLYAATEMFVDGLLHLYNAGILKRKVYDFWALQQLINEGRCDPERLSADVLGGLESLGVRVIRTKDFEILQHHGFFNATTRYEHGHLIAPDGTRVIANVADPEARRVMGAQCLGDKLRNGIVLHGAFFLGPRDFYEALRAMPEEERRLICMTGVNKVNQLDLNPRLFKLQRQHARFMNTGIMVTLSGAVVSDALDDGRVISGVGGQYNFVAMAHQLDGGRSILMIRAVRDKEGKTAAPSSNIVFNYGHCTIPRHLRDLVITEYGIADLRGRSDNEIIKALLNVADSRFQDALLTQAKASGKLEADYRIPALYHNNTPTALAAKLKPFAEQLPAFPFGSDFTAEELVLAKALRGVKAAATRTPKWKLLLRLLSRLDIPATAQPYLQRMGLEKPQSLQDRIARRLLLDELRKANAL